MALCFAKILGPQNGGYSPLTDCATAKANGEIDTDYCSSGNDYYAGAVKACGGKKNNLPSEENLKTLAQELYNTTAINGGTTYSLTLATEKAAPFLAQSSYSKWFYVWSSEENGSTYAYDRYFGSDYTGYVWGGRSHNDIMAVCISTK